MKNANPSLQQRTLAGLRSPLAATLGMGAATAGLSVLGNRNELENKGAGRVITEALGAGLLGGLAGKYMFSPAADHRRSMLERGMYDNKIIPGIENTIDLGLGVGIGGLGGMVGGGVANALEVMGAQGFQDPNGYKPRPLTQEEMGYMMLLALL